MDVPAVTAVTSGFLIVVLGLAILSTRGRRPGTFPFALFALAWGAEVVCFNLSRFTESSDLLLLRLGLAFSLAEIIFFVHFVRTFPRGGSPDVALGVAAVAGVLAALFVLQPDSLVRIDVTPEGDRVAVFPPAGSLLGFALFAVRYVGLAIIARTYLLRLDVLERRESALILGALSLYAAYTAPARLLAPILDYSVFVSLDGALLTLTQIVLFAFGCLCVGAIAFVLIKRVSRGTHPEQRRTDLLLVSAILSAAIVGVVGGFFFSQTDLLVGFVRLGTALLIAYGLLKHQIFGLDLQLKRGLRTTAPVLAFLLLALVAGAFVRALTPDAQLAGLPLFFLAGLAVGGTGAAVAVPLRARAANAVFPGVTDSTGYRRARSLEVYQAALAQAVARGDAEQDPLLPALRTRLGLTQTDHESLLYVVRADVKSPDAPSPAPPTVPNARYRREKLLSEGAFANVWLAEDTTLQRKVVMKEFLRAGDPTPYDEARASSGLAHPNVVTVYDVVPEGERASLILEYVPGGSLQARLDRDGRIPETEAVRITRDVLRGLAALHRRGLVHQDVKPANVLLADDGTAKVTDFGISDRTATREANATAGATLGAGAGPGTLHYMSPEQAEGAPTDARADLYATGALLYRAMAGRFYVEFGNAGEYRIRKMILEDPPRLPLDGASAKVNAFLARTLAKSPDARYANTDEALAALP